MGRDSHAVVVLVCGDAELARWPLSYGNRCALAVVDDMARLQLAAQRAGCSVRLRDASAELRELLDLVGLGEILAKKAGLLREVAGQPEGREELGVEEIVMPDDPVA